jgi:CheY-like chemotaxis protein
MYRVLLVEDNRPLRELTRIVIERTGRIEVVGEAENGQIALIEARRLQPDLILLDLHMSVMDGFEAIPHLRRFAPAAKIVAYSMLRREIAEPRARALGADDYIDKATGDAEVARRLVELLDAATPARPGPAKAFGRPRMRASR